MGIAGDQLCLDWMVFSLMPDISCCQDSVLVALCSFDPKVTGSNFGMVGYFFIFFAKILNTNVPNLLFKYVNLLYIKSSLSYEKIKAEKLSWIWQLQGLNCGTLAYKCEMLGNDLFLSKISILNCKNLLLNILEIKIQTFFIMKA